MGTYETRLVSMTARDGFKISIDSVINHESVRISGDHLGERGAVYIDDADILDATIRTLCAIRNARHYGLGIRELFIITKGEYKDVLCMELVRAVETPGFRDVHLIEFDKGWLCPPVAKVVNLPREFYQAYNPSAEVMKHARTN